MKRLLAISWEMPPLSGPRAVQVTRTLQHLVPQGWASTVICFGPKSTRYNQDYRIEPERTAGGAIELVRVPSPEEWLVVRALWRVCPPIKRLPDEKRVWVHRAVAAGRSQLRRHRFDAVASFAQPWSDHLVAEQLHREAGVPWVAHFSDPWVESPYAPGAAWQRRVWGRMEQRVVREATRVVFQNRQTAARTMNKYPTEWMRKVAVIPQGFEPEPSQGDGASRPGGGPLRVVYTGRFYPGVRTPDTVLAALDGLRRTQEFAGRLRVDFFGRPWRRYARRACDLGLDQVVAFHGRVSPPEAQAAARSADVLLVIDAPSRGPNLFLPSKLVDYLPLRKPILGVTPLEGASADLLRSLGYPIVDPNDVDGITRVFAELLDRWRRGALSPSPSHDEVARAYDIRETTRRFAELLDSVAPGAAGAA